AGKLGAKRASDGIILRPPGLLPLLALRDVVVYPHMQIALFVGREKSINAVDVARNSDNLVFVVAQKDSLTEEIDHDN
ncbi:LON peptidase substrate-binding domain-containing protein, partial [Klebsiella pneumoniae]